METTASPSPAPSPAPSPSPSPLRKLSKEERAAEQKKREAERLEKAQQKEAERLKREEEKRKKDEEKEQERLKREEEKRKKDEEREQERLKREEEKRKKDEEKEQDRIKREEEKRKKDEEKEQQKIKREEEKRKKDEEKEQERLKREEEKRKKDEEKEQERLRREEERLKKELERKQASDEKEKEKLKAEEALQKQAKLLTRFLQTTPGGSRKSGSGSGEFDKSIKTVNSESAADTSITSCGGNEMDVTNGEPEISIIENSDETSNGLFKPMPFQVKNGMALAPRCRRILTTEEKSVVDIVLNPPVKVTTDVDEPMEVEVQNCESAGDEMKDGINQGLYLHSLKKGLGRKGGRTEVRRKILNEDNEVQIVDEKEEEFMEFEESDNPFSDAAAAGLVRFRWKLIQFHENTRPAYWGTWKRRPLKIKGKCPFKQEEELDYEFDSDDEWEEEPADGEDLNSEKDEEEEEPDAPNADDEDDEGWMVPHGYLSEDEGDSEEKRDIDTLKNKEEQYYKDIRRGNTLGLPIIETEDLYQYRMIFPPKSEQSRPVNLCIDSDIL